MAGGRDLAFARRLEEEAPRLASFVLALIGDRHRAEDVFQSTCLELWRIRHTFRPGTDFGAWSRTVARHQVRRFRRKTGRERIAFSSAAVERIAEAYAAPPEDEDTRLREALEACLEKLTGEQRELLRRRYNDGAAIRVLARETGRSEAGLKMMLMRLRRKLGRCIRRRIAREGGTVG